MTTTRECGHCHQDNPADTTTCTFCTEPLDSPDPIQEADLTDPPTTHREEPTMSDVTEGPSVTYHWIATVQTGDGRISTDDGPVSATPGIHTHTSTYRAVLANLTEKYGPNFGLLFFALEPDQI